jgi:hypothetical protein
LFASRGDGPLLFHENLQFAQMLGHAKDDFLPANTRLKDMICQATVDALKGPDLASKMTFQDLPRDCWRDFPEFVHELGLNWLA